MDVGVSIFAELTPDPATGAVVSAGRRLRGVEDPADPPQQRGHRLSSDAPVRVFQDFATLDLL